MFLLQINKKIHGVVVKYYNVHKKITHPKHFDPEKMTETAYYIRTRQY